VSVFALSHFSCHSLATIDRHYGHVARDSGEHVGVFTHTYFSA